MRLQRVVITAALVLSALASGIFTLGTIPPREYTKSQFLTGLDPTSVVEQYATLHQCVGGSTNAAGYRYPWKHQAVFHDMRLDCTFYSDPVRNEPMMAALIEKVRRSLATTNAVITFEQVEKGRFAIHYRSGRTEGSIQAELPNPNYSRPFGRLTLRVEETWAVLGLV